jgi:uncharacterized protein (UPF0276 family)
MQARPQASPPNASSENAIAGAGIGLRGAHYRDFLQGRPEVAWIEVHSENYFGAGGYDLFVLESLRSRYPLSLHGVGLSLGSADGLREQHLDKLQLLAARVEPALISEHLCWGALAGQHFNDLLPLPYTGEALNLMVERVSLVQERLRRRILIENVSTYLAYRDSDIPEFVFLAELAAKSGCGILLDVNNLYVNSRNHGFDAETALAALPRHAIGEIHLAGHSIAGDCLIDDHASRVTAEVWELYRSACARFGAVPALIEWDTDIPPLTVLLEEAMNARAIMEQSLVPA